MGHSKVIIWLATLALLAPACASIQKSLRQPGEKLKTFPELVWEEYDCESQKRPFFVIEDNELVPRRIKPGKAFNHRLVYAMCPKKPTEVVQGRLQTRIRYRGNPIVRENTEAYEIKPGRWIVDAEIVLPEAAEPGVYAYELAFKSRSIRFEKSLTFVVNPR